MSKLDSLFHISRHLLLVLALGVICALSASTAIYLAMWQREVQTPTLIGKTFDQARQITEQAGLELHEKNSLYDERYAPKTVIEQWPQAGMTIKRGQPIRVNVSLGPRPVKPEPAQSTPAPEESQPVPKQSPSPPTTAPTSTIASEKSKTQSQAGSKDPRPESEKKKADSKPVESFQLLFGRSESKIVGDKPKSEAEKKKGDANRAATPQPRLNRSETKLAEDKPKEKKPDRNGSVKDQKNQPAKKPGGKIH